ncbi:YaaR family protein [Treponema sp. OttesenSCG-928-L16]|nr:YaaR family protein [Treponema sp. OttesenSCG-928-L16]
MAKIDFPDASSPFFNPAAYTNIKAEAKKTKEKGGAAGIRRKPFSSILEQTDESAAAEELRELPASEQALQELLDDVHSTGDELKNRPFPEEIKQYKRAVRNFLHYVVENSYTTEKQHTGVNFFKKKSYTLIQVVDRKLEQLAAAIMAGQSSQMDILARLDEIAGLLVDMLQ